MYTCFSLHTICVVAKSLEPCAHAPHVLLRVDKDIIKKYKNKIIQVRSKNVLHQMIKVGWGIS